MRRVSALAALLLAFAAPAPAQDAPPAPPAAPSAFAARSPDVARASAAKLWGAASEARRVSLYEFARRAASKAVALDPENREARAFLGWTRRDGAWVQDAALAAKTPSVNFPEKPPPIEQAAQVERKWMRETWPAARQAAAAAWTALGEDCARKLDADGAKRAHERALELDPEQARSRAALGYFRFATVWVTERQYRAIEAACRAEIVDADSPADKALGGKLRKVQTPHFRLESRLSLDRLSDLARHLETAYAVHLVEIGRDPTEAVFQSRVQMIVCDTDAEWNGFVNTFIQRDREFLRGLEGCWWENWLYGMRPPKDGSDDTRRDHLVHRAVHAVDSFALGIFWPHWADEGLAHLTTIRIHGSTRTWCLAPSQSQYAKLDREGGKSGWIDESEWRAVARASALARDDVPLRTLALQKFPELGFAGAIKAWSVLEQWRTEDPESFRALLPKLRNAKDADRTIEQHFGRGLEALDEEWRRYVLRTY